MKTEDDENQVRHLDGDNEELTLAAEVLHVQKRDVTRKIVTISKRVGVRTRVVDEPLNRETVEVERVPIHRLIQGDPPAIREEEGVTVIPVIEEVLVTEKRLMLVEEIRMHRKKTVYHNPQEFTLRYEYVEVERTEPQAGLPAAENA
jgi:uncharacterized protein (TIGR02271 family)